MKTLPLLAALCCVSLPALAQPFSSGNANINPGLASITSSAAEASHVLKVGAGNLYGAYAISTVAGYFMVFDAATVPASGAVTPKDCVAAAANTTQSISYGAGPAETFTTGIVLAFSTTGCLSFTPSATAWFHGSVQ